MPGDCVCGGGTKAGLVDFHVELPILDLGVIAAGADAWCECVLAGGDMELPAVPWAGDDIAAERTFSERSAGVRADAVEDVEFSGQIVDGEDPAIGDNFAGCAFGEIGGIDEVQPGHVWIP